MTRKKPSSRPRVEQPQPNQHAESRRFASALLAWYDANARELPWRQSRDPYRIWLSEVMLQQTRVQAVLEHYRLFLKKFPTVHKLASAREASVLAAWSGLGYYRRARMLHAAAKVVVRELDGKFPTDSEGWRSLPGIGRYTAAAIASISANEPTAVVDGNVERAVSRLSGKTLAGEAVWENANSLLDRTRPGDFNQAMMELGATICLPRQPRCLLCPVMDYCSTRGELPWRRVGTAQKKRIAHFGLSRTEDQVFLVRRGPGASLMPGMWELPELPAPNGGKPLFSLRHSITVTDYAVHVVEMNSPEKLEGEWVAHSRLSSLPLTGLARKILRRAEML
jgi:A/G-specific adenine glycosylase